jgi:hypothetical protein
MGRPLARWAAALLTLAALVGAAALARADGPPPSAGGAWGVDADNVAGTGVGSPLDTEVTPKIHDRPGWQWAGGALFGKTAAPDDSPTAYDTDLFTVAFRNIQRGLAGGAACAQGGLPPEQVDGCERVPVIYRYRLAEVPDPDAPGGTVRRGRWEEVYRGTGPGFVAAIVWLDATHALAVGGDGVYPRREDGRDQTAPGYKDPAGHARAWEYDAEGGGWREMEGLPAGMGALTAVDAEPGGAWGAAGGLGQLWEYTNGQFVNGVDRFSPSERLKGANSFRFRVRTLHVVQTVGSREAFAMTAGCCADTPDHDYPTELHYTNLQWTADPDRAAINPLSSLKDRLALNESTCDFEHHPDNGCLTFQSFLRSIVPGLPSSLPDGAALDRFLIDHGLDLDRLILDEARRRRIDVQSLLVGDSVYAITLDVTAGRPASIATRLYSPGGPRHEPEPPSALQTDNLLGVAVPTLPGFNHGRNASPFGPGTIEPLAVNGDMAFSTARLVAADGDSFSGTNRFPDWLVGQKRSSGQALAYSTYVPRGPNPVVETGNPVAGQPPIAHPEHATETDGSFNYFLLPTYALNAVDELPASETTWAVGDHGAILRYGDPDKSPPLEDPAPPRLGARAPGSLPNHAAFDPFRPLGGVAPGDGVPSLVERPPDAGPGWTAAGSPATQRGEQISEIAMSRDGSEGWAIAAAGGYWSPQSAMVLYHYADGSWTTCETPSQAGVGVADPACAALDAVAGGHLVLRSLGRVPNERDNDPSNDDDFEVVGVGDAITYPGETAPRTAVARYRDGRWALEPPASTRPLIQPSSISAGPIVTFTAPGDGWIAYKSGIATPTIYHWDGTKWADCAPRQNRAGCHDAHGLLPTQLSSASALVMTTAGDRLYLAGQRPGMGINGNGNIERARTGYPMILHCCGSDGQWMADVDPGRGKPQSMDAAGNPAGTATTTAASPADLPDTGAITGIGVARREDGRYEGWATGNFHGAEADTGPTGAPGLMRLDPDGSWKRWSPAHGDASTDYLTTPSYGRTLQVTAVPAAGGGVNSYVKPPSGPLIAFDAGGDRWRVLASPGPLRAPRVFAPDNRGGLWSSTQPGGGPYFAHYSESVPRPVFQDAPVPLRDQITSIAGASDGTLWASGPNDRLARYDRLAGWETVRVPGWDPGRVLTRRSEVFAVAAGPDGSGLAAGYRGRVAELSANDAKLSEAAGHGCDPAAPDSACATTNDLRSAAIASDGSALVGGDHFTLLWRPAGGALRQIQRPADAGRNAIVVGIAMPAPDRAYLASSTGQVVEGQLTGSDWSWRLANLSPEGDSLSVDHNGHPVALRAIAVDGAGHGYAVGDGGMVLERAGDGDLPWKRVQAGTDEDLTAVTLPAGGGPGALVGGAHGLILTERAGRLEVARAADPYDAESGTVTGLAMLPGDQPGQVEAWVSVRLAVGGGELLHYASDSADPLLRPADRVEPLPDAPAPRQGELSFAAFGKSDCRESDSHECDEMSGTGRLSEVISGRIVSTLRSGASAPGAPSFALFTGDANDSGGRLADSTNATGSPLLRTPKLGRWNDLVSAPLRDAGVPVLAAIGWRDLSEETVCVGDPLDWCHSTKQDARSGSNALWRQAMVDAPGQAEVEAGGIRYVPVPDPDGPSPSQDATVDNPGPVGAERPTAPTGGARTHYAVDVVRGGAPVARLVFLDTSVLQTLSAGDPAQQPADAQGQLAWARRMLTSRPRGERAVVVSTTPTYSYGPGLGTDTQPDGAALEAELLRDGADAVVSGRLGWNGLYYALAPGVHQPCPGGPYPSGPPGPAGGDVCGKAATAPATPADAAAKEVADGLRDTGAPPPPVEQLPSGTGGTGALPFVVASGAGGKPADAGPSATASAGSWNGYSVVRLAADGDPRQTIVEQRPILDWLSITAVDHTLGARQRLVLQAVGREPPGTDAAPRYDAIDSPAITHRYDLLAANARQPWLPARDAAGHYAPLDASVATVDDQTGEVRAGAGNHPRAYAVALLSVGDRTATYPLVFEPRRSFRPAPVPARRVVPARPVPPIQVQAAAAAAAPATPPPAPPPPPPGSATPSLPGLPGVPPPAVPPAPPPAAPPAPPVPPPPPASAQPLPLSLNAPLSPIGVTASVIPPSPPPVNPAPPSGSAARREAKQRQAAAARSEEGRDAEGAGESSTGTRLDVADAPSGLPGTKAMTRHDTAPHPFTRVVHAGQPSAWARGALYGGALTLAALLLAVGVSSTRPRPRRRPPDQPAPAWSPQRRR